MSVKEVVLTRNEDQNIKVSALQRQQNTYCVSMQHAGCKVLSIAQPSHLLHSLSPANGRISRAHTSCLAVYRD